MREAVNLVRNVEHGSVHNARVGVGPHCKGWLLTPQCGSKTEMSAMLSTQRSAMRRG